jgi:hypothetical protein
MPTRCKPTRTLAQTLLEVALEKPLDDPTGDSGQAAHGSVDFVKETRISNQPLAT